MNNNKVHSLINGIAADYININDRAIHYGDGIFETILSSNNNLYFWQQHYHRLKKSAQALKLACPDEQLLLADITKLLEKNKGPADTAYAIKIILTRGSGERGYRYTKKTHENRLVMLSAIDKDYSSILSAKLLSGDLCFCQQQVSINESLAGLKHLNRLENVIARNEWAGEYIDGLMLNANQHVIEGTMSNLFAVKDRQLFTPDLAQSGIDGIMRDVIIELAKKRDISFSVTSLCRDELLTMDELFISNSLIGMKSAAKLAGASYEKNTISNLIFDDLLLSSDQYAQTV